jgi:hypothetical protein
MDEDKEVLGANGDSGTTSLQCWVYRTSGFGFRSPTRESEVVVGVLAMNTRRKQRKGLSGNLCGFERFIWYLSNGAEERRRRRKKKNWSPFGCALVVKFEALKMRFQFMGLFQPSCWESIGSVWILLARMRFWKNAFRSEAEIGKTVLGPNESMTL